MDSEMATWTVEVDLVRLDADTGVREEVLVPYVCDVLQKLRIDRKLGRRYLLGLADILVYLCDLFTNVSIARHFGVAVPFLQARFQLGHGGSWKGSV